MIKKKSPESKPNIILETEIHVHLYLTFKDFLVTIYNDMKSSFSIDLHGNKNFDLYRKKFGWKVSSLLQICLIIVLISQNVYEKIFIILVSNF